ncbi:MAG: glycosyltransferase family 39 protein [Candidatus Bathyarchaeia archaeon]
MQVNKRDLLTIVVLSAVFLSLATWNLGFTQFPQSTVSLSNGQGFVLDLGEEANVKSVCLLYKDGHFNVTVSVGTPDNWQVVASNTLYPYDFTKNEWSLDYCKWYELNLQRTTRYINFAFKESPSDAVLSELMVIGQDNQKISVAVVSNAGNGNPTVSNLVDEQAAVQYPVDYMGQTYFDEIYFVRTAEQYLHLQYPYEWTHPPLGKLIQAAGIAVFGFNPFGWRITGVIFATLMIPVVYLLAKKLFGSWIGGFSAAFLLTFDFMHFTMGRMGTADTYVVFFSLLSQLFFLYYFMNVVKKGWKTSVLPLFLAVVFFALGFSTKWLVLYGAVGMLLLLLAVRLRDVSRMKASLSAKYAAVFDHPFLLLVVFILFAVVIYFSTYVPDMIIGRDFPGVVKLQFDMYAYHSGLTATHTFASPWWSWPFLVNPFGGYVPLWLEVATLPNGLRSTIAVFGNPAIWWVGFICILLVTIEAVQAKDAVLGLKRRLTRKPEEPEVLGQLGSEVKTPELASQPQENAGRHWDLLAIFIAVLFFSSWVPYIFISRVTFIYHFYVAVPFLYLASAYFINKYWSTRGGKAAAIAFFISVVILFVVFYPVTSGVPVPTSEIDRLKWFPSWYF